MIKYYFIDTNIAIAFTIITDLFHPNVVILIKKTKRKLIWSTYTKMEYCKKYDEISKQLHSFFIKINSMLRKTECYSYDYFERNALKKTANIKIDYNKKIKILECLWNHDKFNPSIINSSKYFINNFMNSCASHHEELLNKIEVYDCGEDNYKKFGTLKDELNDAGIHKGDDIIILDAHDLSFTIPIIFLSADSDFIKVARNVDFLNIQGYKLVEKKKIL